ncbi:MAG: ATP-dependent DNA helicase RecQ [Planctomycetaceae bacterium]
MQQTPNEILQQVFGFPEFRSGQREVIDCLLAGKSAAAVFPTGGGKSLCYQLPALLLEGTTVVVSPLIALMKDQIDALVARGVDAARLDSSLSAEEYRSIAGRIRSGQLKLLYVAPERFANERFRGMLSTMNISLFAIDEAHCISEWGHNFRPDYLKLAQFAREFNADVILALTATATPGVLSDMCRFLDIDPANAVRTPFYRQNLSLLSEVVEADARDEILLSRIQSRPRGATIVYVTVQKTAEYIAQFLKNHDLPARAYHAGLDAEFRSGVQEWLMQSDDSIVVATIAFGMGIDKSNIRYVYHYNLPKSLENYAQEIGRAGRDGEPSTCEILYCVDDLNVLENFVFGDTPEESAIASLIQDLFDQGELVEVSLYSLSSTHDIRPLVLRTLLTYLQLDGFLQETTPVYSAYQFMPHMPSMEMLQQFEGERREFLTDLLRHSRKAKKWFHIDLEATSQSMNEPRDRLVRALDYLAEQNMLDLKPSKLVHRYRCLKQPADRNQLVASLYERMQHREKRDVERLGETVSLITEQGCQVNRLNAHFGETRDDDCGHCSHCLNPESTASPERSVPPIDETVWQQAMTLRLEQPALQSPILFTRFLCGVTSPRLTKAKLSRHPLSGKLAHVPFKSVLAKAEA